MVVPGGTLDTGQGSFNVEVPGLIKNAADVYSLPLKAVGDTVVTFGDVATITMVDYGYDQFVSAPSLFAAYIRKDSESRGREVKSSVSKAE